MYVIAFINCTSLPICFSCMVFRAQLQFKKKNGEKQLSSSRSVIHVDVSQYTDFCGQQNLEIPFKPTQTTAKKVMQHLSKILSPGIFSQIILPTHMCFSEFLLF